MALNYFHGAQPAQHSYYLIPKALFTDKRYKGASAGAKFLYGLLLDLMSLSVENGCSDEEQRAYITYPVPAIAGLMGCGRSKVYILLNELEKDYGLIERQRGDGGKCNIYPKKIV